MVVVDQVRDDGVGGGVVGVQLKRRRECRRLSISSIRTNQYSIDINRRARPNH